MKKTFLVVRNVFAVLLVLASILILSGNVYGFCTISHTALYVNHDESYIQSVSLEDDSLKCTVVLCIKNLRFEQIDCEMIRLILWENDSGSESFVAVEAIPKNPDLSYISFPGLRSKMIECTFVVDDIGRPLSIDDIDISTLSYR